MSEEKKDPGISVDQYGRKTWDVDVYAKKAKQKQKQKPQATEPDKHLQLSSDKSTSQVIHRENLIESSLGAVNKYTLVNPEEGKPGKKPIGFSCPVCQRSFRDNMALIDHFNSPQHMQNVMVNVRRGKKKKGHEENEEEEEEDKEEEDEEDEEDEEELLDGGIARATPQEVELTLKQLIDKDNKTKGNTMTPEERINKRREIETKNKEKRRAKRQKRKYNEVDDSNDDNEEISKVMGFGKFG